MECAERSCSYCGSSSSVLGDWKIEMRSARLFSGQERLLFTGTGSSQGSMTSGGSGEGLLLSLTFSGAGVTGLSVEPEILSVDSLLKSIRSGTLVGPDGEERWAAWPEGLAFAAPGELIFETGACLAVFALCVLLLALRVEGSCLAGGGDGCCR